MTTTEPENLTKISFNATPRAKTALGLAANHAGISRTDTLNRAVQIYASLIGLGLWRAIWVLLSERATVRRFAAEAEHQARLAAETEVS